jgi:hypothetical protein
MHHNQCNQALEAGKRGKKKIGTLTADWCKTSEKPPSYRELLYHHHLSELANTKHQHKYLSLHLPMAKPPNLFNPGLKSSD